MVNIDCGNNPMSQFFYVFVIILNSSIPLIVYSSKIKCGYREFEYKPSFVKVIVVIR